MLARNSKRTPSRSDSLTRYRNEGGQCQPVTQNAPHLGRVHLQSTEAKEGSVCRRFSTYLLNSTSGRFTYCL